jgi:CheY-like chemotaxis protein
MDTRHMDTRLSAVTSYLPALRRYAQAYAGSRLGGDAYLEICLEVLLEDPRWLRRQKTLRLDLFKLLHAVIDRVGDKADGSGDTAQDSQARMRDTVLSLSPLRRRLVLLLSFEDLQTKDLAYIMGLEETAIRAQLQHAWKDIYQRPQARVLILEDEELIAADISDAVEELGHTVVGVASNERSAIELARTMDPELVLADVRLRGGSGARAVEQIRGKTRVPVIFITGYPDGVISDGTDDPVYVMAKPFRREDLKQTISRALKEGPGPRPVYM